MTMSVRWIALLMGSNWFWGGIVAQCSFCGCRHLDMLCTHSTSDTALAILDVQRRAGCWDSPCVYGAVPGDAKDWESFQGPGAHLQSSQSPVVLWLFVWGFQISKCFKLDLLIFLGIFVSSILKHVSTSKNPPCQRDRSAAELISPKLQSNIHCLAPWPFHPGQGTPKRPKEAAAWRCLL